MEIKKIKNLEDLGGLTEGDFVTERNSLNRIGEGRILVCGGWLKSGEQSPLNTEKSWKRSLGCPLTSMLVFFYREDKDIYYAPPKEGIKINPDGSISIIRITEEFEYILDRNSDEYRWADHLLKRYETGREIRTAS